MTTVNFRSQFPAGAYNIRCYYPLYQKEVSYEVVAGQILELRFELALDLLPPLPPTDIEVNLETGMVILS